MSFEKDFGSRLLLIRTSLGLTHKEVAKLFGVRAIDWRSAEVACSHTGLFRAPTFASLADAGFSLDWLFTGEGEMRRRGTSVENKKARGFVARWFGK